MHTSVHTQASTAAAAVAVAVALTALDDQVCRAQQRVKVTRFKYSCASHKHPLIQHCCSYAAAAGALQHNSLIRAPHSLLLRDARNKRWYCRRCCGCSTGLLRGRCLLRRCCDRRCCDRRCCDRRCCDRRWRRGANRRCSCSVRKTRVSSVCCCGMEMYAVAQ
jgi:hypothetical protein